MADKARGRKKRQSSASHTVSGDGKDDSASSSFSASKEELPKIDVVSENNSEDGCNGSAEDQTSLAAAFEEQVRPYIDLIDDLRCHGLDKDINLPSVVVIGDQSSGKSSILEAISGVQLPRGSGIVTRCPLEMQLKKTVAAQDPWRAKLKYQPTDAETKNIDIERPGDTGEYIEAAQNEIAGTNKGISSTIITLRVESPSCPNVTLIDLPGIARIPVGDQPEDICQQIKDLLTDYIRRPNTIILCVIPCNVDIAVNEALSMAKAVDAEGSRTLGVLTKPDLVDEGNESDIMSILNNEKFNLTKGYLIVRCRGQQDILNNVGLATALDQEKRFFEQHQIFSDVREDMRGTKQLSERLSTLLVEHIQNTLPEIRNDVRKKLDSSRNRMQMLGEGPPTEENEKRFYLMRLLDDALKRLKDLLIDGDSISNKVIPLISRGLNPGITYNSSILWRQQAQELKIEIETVTTASLLSGDLSASRVAEKMKHCRGKELPNFINYKLFEKIVQEHILQYKGFIKIFLEKMSSDVELIVAHVFNDCFSHLPSLKRLCRGIAEEVRESCKVEAYTLLDLELKRENLIFTQDNTFEMELDKAQRRQEESAAQLPQIGSSPAHDPTSILASAHKKHQPSGFSFGSASVPTVSVPISTPVTRESTNATPSTSNNSQIMRNLLSSYLNIANRRYLDNIPLLFRMKLHYDFFDILERRLQKRCSDSEVLGMVQEEVQTMIERKNLTARIERLTHAMAKLNYRL